MLKRRHVCERPGQKITSEGFVAYVAHVILPDEDPTAEVIDPVHGSDA